MYRPAKLEYIRVEETLRTAFGIFCWGLPEIYHLISGTRALVIGLPGKFKPQRTVVFRLPATTFPVPGNSTIMNDPRELFHSDPLPAYESGAVSELIGRRNPTVANLLGSERALAYAQIAYRMLLMRRGHELEPLHEDLYHAVAGVQERTLGQPYGQDQFNIDIHQLIEWNLITVRLEKERIRGYRDTRRTKYRYGLTSDTIHFLVWLEERLQDDLEDRTPDARDLLEELCGTVHELVKLLRALARRSPDDAESRRILFQIYKSEQITHDIAASLTEFNARMLGFLVIEYNIEELRDLLTALREYVDRYLSRIATLRADLIEDIRRLGGKRYRERLYAAYTQMESERRNAPQLLQSGGRRSDPSLVARDLYRFYRDEGTLDSLCHRINGSALHVWQRMSSHLKELERRSNRIEDIRMRLRELAELPPDTVPTGLITSVLSWAHMRGDMHFWDHEEKADPPRPRRNSWKRRQSPATILRPKTAAGAVVHSMEQERLKNLLQWLSEMGLIGNFAETLLSRGDFQSGRDLGRILELARAGILAEGRKLKSVGCAVMPLPEFAKLTVEEIRMYCPDLRIVRDSEETD